MPLFSALDILCDIFIFILHFTFYILHLNFTFYILHFIFNISHLNLSFKSGDCIHRWRSVGAAPLQSPHRLLFFHPGPEDEDDVDADADPEDENPGDADPEDDKDEDYETLVVHCVHCAYFV